MKKFFYALAAFTIFSGCKTTQTTTTPPQPVVASLDLVNVQDDKVQVTVDPARFSSPTTTFYIPKTVPGTYSEDNYGRFIENFRALDYNGNELQFVQDNENSWTVSNATDLDKVIYSVNDTYDVQGEGGVFSPSGTNIEKGKNFMLNLHGFVGYFEGLMSQQYRLEIKRPETLIPGTALTVQNSTAGDGFYTDVFQLNRYFEVTDNPVMYARPDTTSF